MNAIALSALFVTHEPQGPAGSVRINITQPSSVRTVTYPNDFGAGPAIEETGSQAGATVAYAPRANVYVENVALPNWRPIPLDQLPLSVAQVDFGPTRIMAIAAWQGITADQFIHPMAWITSTSFTGKKVAVVGEGTIGGRSYWDLRGVQVPGTPFSPLLGNAWRVWVDRQTGVILRMEWYNNSTLLGWAALTQVAVDKPGVTLPRLHLPASARRSNTSQYLASVFRVPGTIVSHYR